MIDEQQIEQHSSAQPEKICYAPVDPADPADPCAGICGISFTPKSAQHKFCSTKCRVRSARAKQKAVANYTPHLKINLLFPASKRTLLPLGVSEPVGRAVPLPAQGRSSIYKEVLQFGPAFVAALNYSRSSAPTVESSEREPYFAGVSLDSSEIREFVPVVSPNDDHRAIAHGTLHEAHLGELRFRTLYLEAR
jgi:hypothetical protein